MSQGIRKWFDRNRTRMNNNAWLFEAAKIALLAFIAWQMYEG